MALRLALCADAGIAVDRCILVSDSGNQLRWVQIVASRLRRRDGSTLVAGSVADISGRRQVEDALRASEARLATVFNQTVVGILNRDRNHNVLLVNDHFLNLIGRSAEDLQGLPMEAFTHPDDMAWNRPLFDLHYRTGKPFIAEKRYVRPDGSVVWVKINVSFVPDGKGNWTSTIVVAHDITARKNAEEALKRSEVLSHGIVEASPDCILLLDGDGVLRFINGPGLRALEITDPSTVYGRSYASLWPDREQRKVRTNLMLARAGKTSRFTAFCPTATGRQKWWDVVVTPLVGGDGYAGQLLAIARDATDERVQAERVRWTANHDTLTGLPNRSQFHDQLEQRLARAAGRGEPLGLLALDVDNLKLINDGLGHDAGDTLLKAVADRLKGVIRKRDLAARLSGDEFAVVIAQPGNERDLLRIGNKILGALKEPLLHQGYIIECRMSIGAALYPDDGDDAGTLLKSADTALYAAKMEGRDRVMLFRPSMRADVTRRLAMVDHAQEALARDDILPFYQPKICLHTGAVMGFEALLRWRTRDGQILLPAGIAAAFDDPAVAQRLSERIQDKLLLDMRRWLDDGVPFDHIAINAAAAEFRRQDFAECLLSKLEAARIPPACVELEVTETVFLGRGSEHVARMLRVLHENGMRIALDDFGTGYASLSHLKDFPVDIIKIDQSFVGSLGNNADSDTIVRALLSLAVNLGIRTVAEGIETPAQWDFLVRHGCDLGQGFLFGHAMDAAQLPEFLAKAGAIISPVHGKIV